MQELFDVNWLTIVVGALAAFFLGAVWYSPVMFSAVWQRGVGAPVVPNRPLAPLLLIQFAATVVFAWALVTALQSGLAPAILVALAAAGLVKSNGLFAGKGLVAVGVEGAYVVAQAVVIILAAQIIN